MSYKQNLHTHSTFCDGKNSPEELVQEAIARGFDSLGFSMHSYVPCSGIGSLAAIRDYQEEILRLKKAYDGRLKIYLGIEYDIDSVHGPEGFAYTIASVHCLKRNGVCFDFDRKLEQTRELIDQYFDGDGMAFAKCYYERVSQIPQYGSFDVLGHFDLVAKNNEQGKFFDTQSAQYLQYAVDTIHALQGKIPLFEVNTGCIARGYRSTAYPQMALLKEFYQCGFGAVISSDCHHKDFLDYGFEDAKQMLKTVGYRGMYVLTDEGFREVPIV